jgi:pimeloyl-ACP methyl ester carboxylesterase
LTGELGIEPSPALRELEGRILRQDAALAPPAPGEDRVGGPGARSGSGARSEAEPPVTRYARSGDGVHIAYQVLGQGERDIVIVPGLISHLDLWWEDPYAARFYRRLASLGRLIMFDQRDTGLSDRAAGEDTAEQRIEDVGAVMRACGSDRAVLFGYSEGGPMSILFAARYPERVAALILGAASARWPAAPGYPCGEQTEEMASAIEDLAARRWGQGDSIDWYAPSLAGSDAARRSLARWERMAASPSAILRMMRMIREIDVRDVLPGIGVPALIIQRRQDRITPPCHGRYLAAHLPGARYFEQPGDHLLWLGDTDAMFGQIRAFLGETPGPDMRTDRRSPSPAAPAAG